MNWRFAIPLAAFAALCAVFAIGLWNTTPRDPALDAPRALPAFDLPAVRTGQPGLAREDLAGQVSLVNVFASWCPSCVVEHPFLMQIAAEQRAPLYGVAWVDGPGKAAAWLDRHGNPYLRTGEDADGALGVELGVTGAPETFVIDRQGRVRHRFVGPLTEESWQSTIAPLIAQLEAEAPMTN
ncbi:MAG: DsbE family thiol:disulfide interchange protein [Hyphomonadaceae bacterium]|nr:DsbE family thiol:disulfide interchange protein [Hyphomonadaceae bacterium]